MSAANYVIREMQQDDDFKQIKKLLLEHNRPSSYFPRHEEGIRRWFFHPDLKGKRQGYVVVDDTDIIAFIGLDLRGKYSVFVYAVRENDQGNTNLLSNLLKKCETFMIRKGSQFLSYFAFTEFGQIRNDEISVLERLGFRTQDQYMRVSTRLMLNAWKPPNDLDISKISTETFEIDQIAKLLTMDENTINGVIFKHQFYTNEPSNVYLTLRNENHDITALAYYKVKKVNPNSDRLSATAFNLHFRPQFEISRIEKRQFLQAVLSSMKQLDLYSVYSLMALNNVDTFTLMVREGFDDIRGNFFALYKTVGKTDEQKV